MPVVFRHAARSKFNAGLQVQVSSLCDNAVSVCYHGSTATTYKVEKGGRYYIAYHIQEDTCAD